MNADPNEEEFANLQDTIETKVWERIPHTVTNHLRLILVIKILDADHAMSRSVGVDGL